MLLQISPPFLNFLKIWGQLPPTQKTWKYCHIDLLTWSQTKQKSGKLLLLMVNSNCSCWWLMLKIKQLFVEIITTSRELSLYLANYLGKNRKSKFKYLNSDSFSDFFVQGIDTFVLPMVITTSYNFYNCFTKHIK